MATDNRLRDTSSDFNDIYGNPSARFGVENAKVSRETRNQTLTSRPSEDGRRGRTAPRRYRGPQEQTETEFVDRVSRRQQMIESRYMADSSSELQPANTDAAPQKQKIKTSLFARGRGLTFGVATLSWLTPIYFLFQVPMSIIGAVTLGISFQIESSYLSPLGEILPSFSLFGYDFNSLAGLGLLAMISSGVIGILTACIAAFTALLAGLHPLSGDEAGQKHKKFLVGVVGGAIPFINMYPWIISWVFTIMRHPK